ncbi:MAG: hypothetical protein ACI9AR_000376 [Flavobacteriaceae bacterium]|jgi:hypothetical protein
MKNIIYFIEIWFEDPLKTFVRELSSEKGENLYPHNTFTRPFVRKNDINEDELKEKIISILKENKDKLSLTIEGIDNFEDEEGKPVWYLPVYEKGACLSDLDKRIEDGLEKYVVFKKKLNDTKIFHIHIPGKPVSVVDYEPIHCCSDELVVLRDKKIWFSFEFSTGRVYSRAEVLKRRKG